MTPQEFLSKTQSAAEHLFRVVEEYTSVIHCAPLPPTLDLALPIGGTPTDAEFAAWFESTASERELRRKAEELFLAETAALSTICGALLQLAATGIQLTGPVRMDSFPDWFPEKSRTPKVSKFCAGRSVYGVPLGLVIYAGRNQHAHLDDSEGLHPATSAVLGRLQTFYSAPAGIDLKDPAFDPARHPEASIAHNVTAALEWRCYSRYQEDMEAVLGVS